MRSSVVQYDSDGEGTENIKQLQHNSNGIARIVVGGNEAESCIDEIPTSPNTDITVTIGSSTTQHTSVEDLIADGDDEAALVGDAEPNRRETGNYTDRHSGDGATSNDSPPPVTIPSIIEMKHPENTNEGIYDNIQSLKGENPTELSPADVGIMLRSYDSSKRKQAPAVISDDEEEEYQLVLTGLKQLTKPDHIVGSVSVPETRYPHQIIAAMSTSQISNIDSETTSGDIEPIVFEPKQATDRSKLSPLKSGRSKAPPSSPVQKRTKSKSSKQEEKTPRPMSTVRPQSVSSALHLIKSTNNARRSTRKKGQYKSIAEYEKLNESKVVTPETPVHSQNVSQKIKEPSLIKEHVQKQLNPMTASHHSSSNFASSRLSNTAYPNASPFPQIQRRKENRGSPSLSRTNADIDAMSRRASILSISSVPNHMMLRRVSSTDARMMDQERKSKSRSFERKISDGLRLPVHRPQEENVAQRGLTLVGSKNSLVSHGQSQSNAMTDSRIFYQSEPASNISLGEPYIASTPVLDGKHRSRSQSRPTVSSQTSLHWTPSSEYNKQPVHKAKYISLPNTPDMSNYRNHKVAHRNRNSAPWEHNPGFKRFFDSILRYGPNGSKTKIKDHSSKFDVLPNQPDIVLESLAHEHGMLRADDSDDGSSIRSSASAYWPPELKQQSNCDDFEETASWQFHTPTVGADRYKNLVF